MYLRTLNVTKLNAKLLEKDNSKRTRCNDRCIQTDVYVYYIISPNLHNFSIGIRGLRGPTFLGPSKPVYIFPVPGLAQFVQKSVQTGLADSVRSNRTQVLLLAYN